MELYSDQAAAVALSREVGLKVLLSVLVGSELGLRKT